MKIDINKILDLCNYKIAKLYEEAKQTDDEAVKVVNDSEIAEILHLHSSLLNCSIISNDELDEVFLVLSPEGSIGLSLGNGNATVYSDKADCENVAKWYTEHYKSRGYKGDYSVITCKIKRSLL